MRGGANLRAAGKSGDCWRRAEREMRSADWGGDWGGDSWEWGWAAAVVKRPGMGR